MPKISTKNFFIILVVLLVLLGGAGATLVVLTKKKPAELPKIELTYWGMFNTKEVIQPIIDKYQTLHPNVTIRYEQKEVGKDNPVVAYEQDLRNAFAAGNAPDIFELQNMMIPKYESLIEPLPDADTHLVDDYFDVLSQDALIDNKLYALPYSIDSLALYYNKRLLNDAGVANAPRTWDEFDEAVQKLRKLNDTGQFTQSGAALGGYGNINRATDILSLFLLQQGTTITDKSNGNLVWDNAATDPTGNKVNKPGFTGLQRYLRYANPVESVYTWNNAQDYSFDAFAQEKVGMIISYAYALPIILDNNPKMQLGISPLPQPKDASQKITYANYWLETVSGESKNTAAAWDFLKFATNKENVKLYSSETNKPVSRRDLVNDELNDTNLAAFAEQNLYAQSWYQYDGPAVEAVLASMLTEILKGTTPVQEAYRHAGDSIQKILADGEKARQQARELKKAQEEAAKAAQNQTTNSTK